MVYADFALFLSVIKQSVYLRAALRFIQTHSEAAVQVGEAHTEASSHESHDVS